MCRSVPHKPTVFTRISTSLGPIAGTGICCSVNPGAALILRSARIVSGMAAVVVGRSVAVEVITNDLRSRKNRIPETTRLNEVFSFLCHDAADLERRTYFGRAGPLPVRARHGQPRPRRLPWGARPSVPLQAGPLRIARRIRLA